MRVGFNPPPAVRPGETLRCTPRDLDAIGFNPPPAVRPGETSAVRDSRSRYGFNPPPAVRPGETLRDRLGRAMRQLFQSAPGGEAGGNDRGPEHAPSARAVSIRPRR